MGRLPRWFLLLPLLCCARADAFCGFYVASGDAKLFNHASKMWSR